MRDPVRILLILALSLMLMPLASVVLAQSVRVWPRSSRQAPVMRPGQRLSAVTPDCAISSGP